MQSGAGGGDSSTDSTCHSTASRKRNTRLAGITLIAPLTAKKNLYAGRVEGIHS